MKLNLPLQIREKRQQYKDQEYPRFYSGVGHLLINFGFLLVAMIVAFSQVMWEPSLIGIFLLTLFIGSTTVYFFHRYPLHHPVKYVRKLYTVHTLYHHYMFNDEHMQMEEIDDLFMVLFHPGLVIFFGLIFIPATALVFTHWSINWAYFYAGVGYVYFFAYELIHLLSHTSPAQPWYRWPILGSLLMHHRKHHRWEVMNKRNFNMVIPLWDWLLKTKY